MEEKESFVTHVDENMVRKNADDTNQFWVKRREFGSFNEAAHRVNRLRKLVILFGGIVLVLVASLAFVGYQWMSGSTAPVQQQVAQLPKSSEEAASAGVPLAQASNVPTVEILISTRHIPKGEELAEDMFRPVSVSFENVPEGSIAAEHLESVLGKFAQQSVSARSPLLQQQVADLPLESRQLTPFYIPPGHRALAIEVDRRTSVEGFAKPGTFVDVFWFYADRDGTNKLARIVPRAKILSVGGRTEGVDSGRDDAPIGTTVTLLVTLRDAKLLELARNLGKLSLTLVSDEDGEEPETEADYAVTVRDIFRRVGSEEKEESFDGHLKTYDPRLGKWVNYKLSSGNWKVEVDKTRKAPPRGTARARLANPKGPNADWMTRGIPVQER